MLLLPSVAVVALASCLQVPEFLHTFSRKVQQSNAHEMDMNKIAASHQAAREWVQCTDEEGFPYYYCGSTSKSQWQRPAALDDPGLAFKDSQVNKFVRITV